MSLLSVSVQFYARAMVMGYISRKAFWPQPKVDSAIIKIMPQTNKIQNLSNLFFRIVKAGFSQPRKQLVNNLSKGLNKDKENIEKWLKNNNVQSTQRAESLSVPDWIKLAKSFQGH